MTAAWISLGVFCLSYVLFVVFPGRRSWVACGGGLLLVFTGVLGVHEALVDKINWNVIGLFFGMLILAELFAQSRMPAVMAEWLVDRTSSATMAMVAICSLGSAISMFVENVAVVLLIAPVALSLAKKINVSPVRLIICLAVCTNLQGTATLVGDPPSMILAGYMKMSFNDFFIYQGKLGIFFAVQIGAVTSMLVVAWLLHARGKRISVIPVEKVRSWVPTILLTLLILGLSVTSVFDPGFKWLAGTMTLVIAIVGFIWYVLFAKWEAMHSLLKSLDWDTTFFLMGVFVLVGGLSDSGWLEKIAEWIAGISGNNLFVAFIMLISVAVVVSGFVDNVPFLLAMIPVAQNVADSMNAPVPLLLFGLLIGACLGGNITPVGASANVVAMGLLKKEGYTVSFGTFMKVGIPFTIAGVVGAAIFTWVVWAP